MSNYRIEPPAFLGGQAKEANVFKGGLGLAKAGLNAASGFFKGAKPAATQAAGGFKLRAKPPVAGGRVQATPVQAGGVQAQPVQAGSTPLAGAQSAAPAGGFRLKANPPTAAQQATATQATAAQGALPSWMGGAWDKTKQVATTGSNLMQTAMAPLMLYGMGREYFGGGGEAQAAEPQYAEAPAQQMGSYARRGLPSDEYQEFLGRHPGADYGMMEEILARQGAANRGRPLW